MATSELGPRFDHVTLVLPMMLKVLLLFPFPLLPHSVTSFLDMKVGHS